MTIKKLLNMKNLITDESGNSDVLMIVGYVLAIVIIFTVAVSYFIFIPSVAVVLTEMSNQTVSAGVHDITDVNNRVLWSIRMAHFIVVIGTLLFVGILRSTRKEYETY